MADAWTLLVAESSLPEHGHDAWEHLESVMAGSGVCVDAIGPLTMDTAADILAMDAGDAVSMDIIESATAMDMDDALSMDIEDISLTMETCP